MPESWFLEKHTRHVGITLEVRERLFEGQSEFQKVEVLDSPEFGRILLLDGAIMFTERDEPAYHEMLVHPPLFAHPRPERVLIVGGGDGGTIRELLKHEAVRSITLVEIDKMVIDVCRRFFQCLQQGVERPGAQHVDLVDDVHFETRAGGTEGRIRPEFAYVVYAGIARRVDLDDVNVLALGHGRTGLARTAGRRGGLVGGQTVEGLGKNPGHRGFSDAARAGKQVAMMDAPALDRIL